MEINILGTKYELILEAEEKDYPKLKRCDGYTDFSIKKIVVSKFEADETSIEDLTTHSRKVLRHEIIHAFIYESGLDVENSWARNEELVDWIALQFEKILNVYLETKAINIPDDSTTLNMKVNIDGDRLKEILNNNINDLVSIGGDG